VLREEYPDCGSLRSTRRSSPLRCARQSGITQAAPAIRRRGRQRGRRQTAEVHAPSRPLHQTVTAACRRSLTQDVLVGGLLKYDPHNPPKTECVPQIIVVVVVPPPPWHHCRSHPPRSTWGYPSSGSGGGCTRRGVRPSSSVLVGQPHHEGEHGVALGVPHHLPRQEGFTSVICERR
jgi:hypothetical protein